MEVLVLHDANLRVQRRKRVGGDFGAGMGDRRQQSRFSCIGVTNQTYLSYDSEFKKKLTFAALFARLSKTRCLPHGRCKISIAQPASSPFAKDEPLSVLR